MDSATGNVVLAMTTYPNAMTGQTFSNAVQYVFHTGSGLAFAPAIPSTGNIDVIATFDNATPQNIQLWVGSGTGTNGDYVTGNASAAAGITSASGKTKVYAGLVADPFFFNLDGFKAVVSDIESAESSLGVDGGIPLTPFGCPELTAQQAGGFADQLALAPNLQSPPVDHFAQFDGLVIVVSLDKTLITPNGPTISVWGATYASPTAADAGAE
jgi:hypothetical protein